VIVLQAMKKANKVKSRGHKKIKSAKKLARQERRARKRGMAMLAQSFLSAMHRPSA